MAVFKCKMCGGTIEFNIGDTVGECSYCGIKQTLPRLDNDKKANMYDRANHFRRNSDFDKAMSIYEQILTEDYTDAETYWSIVLCRYGIEYVEDPSTFELVPTVNRAQFTSIFMDEDYKAAIRYADAAQKAVYEQEAKTIDDIQKGILDISSKEEPFDVFICYKESDANGRRTLDSVIATDLYHQLAEEGLKVFFSRFTLEDKLGIAYEPYIFAALNTSKVMVVIGTKPEYLNAVWVKNEWGRYLALIKKGAKKTLIPAYRNMSPDDLPDEFSNLQAQDMSKLGFMQDLIRGIKKIVNADTPQMAVKESTDANSDTSNITALLKRAFLFLEDGNFSEADKYCEKVLDQEPENAQAYMGKLMGELQITERKLLANYKKPFDDNGNYLKAIRFGNEMLVAELRGYNSHIKARIENDRLARIYDSAQFSMNSARYEEDYLYAAKIFEGISHYKDSKKFIEKCHTQAELLKSERLAKEEIERIERIRAAEKAAKIRKIILTKAVPIILVCVLFTVLYIKVIAPNRRYNKAMEYYNSGDYEMAYSLFDGLYYKDSQIMMDIIKPQYSKILLAKADVGSVVTFGSYEQDNDTSNGKEGIKWQVLAKKDNRLLVISQSGLDCQPYNSEITEITWDECSLRHWLNKTFLNNVFSSDEQKMIYKSTVPLGKNPVYGTAPSTSTSDKVFLLSANEVEQYFASDKERLCQPTAYAIANGAYSRTNNCSWWLRSPGIGYDLAANVSFNGSVNNRGNYVNADTICIRPVMWLEPESLDNIIISDSTKYNSAIMFMDSGDYDSALELLEGLNYKDSEALIEKCYIKKNGTNTGEIIKNINVGDTYTFGAYEQDNSTINGKENIDWIVLDKSDTSLLLISKQALDCQPYNSTYANIAWKDCSLRRWLNETFMKNAFSDSEQAMLQNTSIPFDNYGNTVNDKVFLLSVDEVEKYFAANKDRKCSPTEYAKAQGAYLFRYSTDTTHWWWLRSVGDSSCCAADVYSDGWINYYGNYVNNNNGSVRPAIWINLEGNFSVESTALNTSEESDAETIDKYNSALEFIDTSDYDSALELLKGLNYADSETLIETCYIGKYGEEKWNMIKDISVGDIYNFGAYEQDNNFSNGKEEIDWIVLDKNGASLLLISERALDCQPFDATATTSEWETCSLRKWLNEDFLNDAFSDSEQKMLLKTRLTVDYSPATPNDMVFLLSKEEFENYIESGANRKCLPTEYAKAQSPYAPSSYPSDFFWWWLRSIGGYTNSAINISVDGQINYHGNYVDSKYGSVRPAIWITLDA